MQKNDENNDADLNVFIPIGSTIDDAEKALIVKTLEVAKGKKAVTAKVLGITRKTLSKKLLKYGISYKRTLGR